MRYFQKKIEVKYDDVNSLVADILDNLNIGNEDYITCTTIVSGDMAEDLFCALMKLDVNGFSFKPVLLDFDNYDYGKEYYITVNNQGEIFVERAWHETNQWHEEGYFYDESDTTFLCNDCSKEIVDYIGNNVVYFDIIN